MQAGYPPDEEFALQNATATTCPLCLGQAIRGLAMNPDGGFRSDRVAFRCLDRCRGFLIQPSLVGQIPETHREALTALALGRSANNLLEITADLLSKLAAERKP